MRAGAWFTKESMGRSAAILTVFQAAEQVILLGRGIVFARVLGPAEYGVFSLAFFFIPLAVALAKLGVPSSFARYIPQYERKQALAAFLRRTYTLVVAGGGLASLLCIVGAESLAKGIYGSPAYAGVMILCGLTLLPNVLMESLAATFSGLRVFLLDSLLRFSQFLMFTALGVGLVFWRPRTDTILASNLAALAVAVVFFGGLLIRHLRGLSEQHAPLREPGFYAKLFRFSSAYMLAPVLFLFFIYSDRWILNLLMDLEQVGIYSVAAKISGLVFTFGMITGNVLIPNLSHLWEEGNRERVMFLINFAAKINTLVLLTAAAALAVTKDVVIPLLYGQDYAPALPVVNALLVFWIVQSANWTLGGYGGLVEKTYITLSANALGLAANVGLNFLLIPRLGIQGAAAASLLATTFIFTILSLWFRREGLRLRANTLVVLASAYGLLFPTWILLPVLGVLAGVALKSDRILNAEEREMVAAQAAKLSARLRRRGAR